RIAKFHRRPDFIGRTASRCRRSRDPRPLGSRPHDVLKIRPSDPDGACAQVSSVAGHPSRQQGRARRRTPLGAHVRRLAGSPAADRYFRQWYRVRLPSGLARPRDRNLLLRSLRPLAKGRHRECHRPDAPLPARARPTSQPSQPVAFAVSLPLTTTPRANPLTSAPPPSPLLNCCTSSVNPPPPETTGDDLERRKKLALKIWADCIEPRGTLAERYLREYRALELPESVAYSVIRFHARLRYEPGKYLPGMVC